MALLVAFRVFPGWHGGSSSGEGVGRGEMAGAVCLYGSGRVAIE